jgi:hypothetical protein
MTAASPTEQDGLDLLCGAEAIATFLFGRGANRKRVYHLVEKSNLPVFRLGSVLCARKNILLGWIEVQERKAAGDGP